MQRRSLLPVVAIIAIVTTCTYMPQSFSRISGGPPRLNRPSPDLDSKLGYCPSLHEVKANMSLTTIYNDTSVLPNGYNVGDILNMPSFTNAGVWAQKGNPYTDTVSGNLARVYDKSVLGLYFAGQNYKTDQKYERSPSLERIALAVEFHGTWFMDEQAKGFCDDLLTKESTLLVHLRSCDYDQVPLSYVHNILKVSKDFDTVVLTGGCHADERYATRDDATSNLVESVDKVYNQMREHGTECKLRYFPNYNVDDALYAFRVASNLLVSKGGFAAVGSLLSQGNVYLDQEMKPYYDNVDFRHWMSNPKLLWNRENNEYAAIFDKMAKVVPTNCLFETFGTGDESKRMCMAPFIHEESCWIMSIGCNGLFGFESDIFFRTKCSVHIFDCTGDWEVPKNIASRVSLHKLCVGASESSEGDRNFLPYEDLVSIATDGLNTQPAYLKLDVEGYEFQVIPAILALPPTIQPVQIGFEVHLITYLNAGPLYAQRAKDSLWFIKDYSDVGLLFFELKSIGGYKLISREDNPFCQHCSELVIMK